MTQQSLAETIGVTRQTVSAYCDGTASPGLDILVLIAKRFGVTTDYLLGLSRVRAAREDIQIAAKTTGLSEAAIESLTSFRVQFHVNAAKTLNALIESDQFPNIVADLSTYLWGIGIEKRCDDGEVVSSALTPRDISKFREIIRDAMIHRIGVSLSQIRRHLDESPQSFASGEDFMAAWEDAVQQFKEHGGMSRSIEYHANGTRVITEKYVPPEKNAPGAATPEEDMDGKHE